MAKKHNETEVFLKVRKSLIRLLGPVQATIIEHFIDLQLTFFKGEFYQQQERISEFMGISKKVLRSNIEKLVLLDVLTVVKKSVDNQPSKNYYTVDIDKVDELIKSEVTKRNLVKSQKGTEVSTKREPTLVTKGNQPRLQKVMTKTRTDETITDETISNKTIPEYTRSESISRKSNFYKNKETTTEEFDNAFAELL